jgi:membrane protease YdiL (CAAX protease family)
VPAVAQLARDPQFAVALAAAPLAWFAGAIAAPANGAWIVADPLRFASLALAWPLLEEWLFRGVIQPALAATRWGGRAACGVTNANIATSVLFAAAHLVSHAPQWAAAAFVPSLVFGYFRDRYRSVAPSAALHVWYNSGWFVFVRA